MSVLTKIYIISKMIKYVSLKMQKSLISLLYIYIYNYLIIFYKYFLKFSKDMFLIQNFLIFDFLFLF